MNSGTLVGSLIFAAVLVVVIAVVIQLMMVGWRRRAARQSELIGTMPAMPDEVGAATTTIRGIYVGSTLSPAWNDRVTAGDLGYRSKAVLTRYPEGILLERIRAKPIWIPQGSITAVRAERGMAGKVAARNSILAIRWRLPSGVEIDTGFRANNRGEYDDWLQAGQEGAA
ncbi:PH-like domain-containing protein [Mycobacterium parmense]|uniref:PH-like domain-containing protein n=1 Tax=Mycobacterium parmense TaxID=185642 RepID=UPI000A1590D3|nr:transporter [Mycobacterium parmense]MCV7351848.1 transporter [Mycobacterium parmense]ORW56746.1 transporter [Mycobacterium parmense]